MPISPKEKWAFLQSIRVSWRGFGGTFFAKKVPPVFLV
jgi:hypothetical protein